MAALYIHIPFCLSKCAYCDFFSLPVKSVSDEYVESLCAEIPLRCRQFGVNSFETVYFGGGTPSLLSAFQLEKILKTVFSSSRKMPEEITIEANPADLTQDFLGKIDSFGINRLSVGIQSVDPEVLRTLNRRSDSECIFSALELLENFWAGRKNHRLSLDFISGLPGLSDEVFMKGLELGSSCGADHISLYALSLEEETPLYKMVDAGKVSYDQDANDRQWLMGRDFLEQHGFSQYEVSNFCRPGCQSRHNMTYWLLNDYIGVGAGATGTIGNLRYTDKDDVCAYCKALAAGQLPPEETENLDEKTKEFEFLMMGFRLRQGISGSEYSKRFGHSFEERICGNGQNRNDEVFARWQKKGLAYTYSAQDKSDTFYALTGEGLLLLNRFLTELL